VLDPVTRPEVLINFAVTVDGKVTTRNLTPARFTSQRDKQRLLEIRALGDALLVGRNTVEKDNMSMGIPDESLRQSRLDRGQTAYPLRVLISNSGQISGALRVFQETFSPIVLYSTQRMHPKNRETLRARADLHLSPSDIVDVKWVLEHLASSYHVRTLVCEGGPSLIRTLAELDVIDRIFLTIAPKLFGGRDAPGLLGKPGPFLTSTRTYRLASMNVVDSECFLEYTAVRT
jgi:riboflavin-specific deaminase-like protein